MPRQFNNRWTPLSIILALTAAPALASDPPITREAAMERLQGDYSLEGVARKHIDVEYDDLLGLSQPLTQRISLQAKHHPDAVILHPDLSIVLGAAADSYCIGFALGTPPRLPAVADATHELHHGYQPIVISRWRNGSFTVQHMAFGVLPEDDAVRTGKEKQDVMVRIAVTNDTDAPATTALTVLIGKADGTQLENSGYGPLRVPASRWQKENLKVAHVEQSLTVNDRVLLTYRTGTANSAKYQPKLTAVQGASDDAIPVNNGLQFDLQLKSKETRTFDFVVAGSSRLYPPAERARMATADFDKALKKAESHWDETLAPGMKLNVPEPRLNNIYKHLVLACLQNVPQEPDAPWLLPHHTPALAGWVWPWEFAYVAIPLDSLGFHRDTEACLHWFTERQSGVGKHGNADLGPDGDVVSTHGCYVGAGSPRWMNETGSVLWMMAAHYRYTRDAEWLKTNRPGMIAACDWIEKQRETTRITGSDGKRVDHYGLLPKGRPHDWEGRYYYLGFTDGYTCKGLADTAAAFRLAGLPEADRLTREADDYRRSILDTLEKIARTDPGTGLLFVPNVVYFGRGEPENAGGWVADGPRVLFDVGILDPVADAKYWQPLYDMIHCKAGFLGGLMCRFSPDGNSLRWDQKSDSPFWYVFQTELNWHRDFLARGELEKALLVFYSNLVYGMSPDLYETVERVNLADSNYAPLSPNASSNGRALGMIRRTVIDEQDETQGVLWLLRGCPHRWFAPGKSIEVRDAPTVFGKIAFKTTCTDRTIILDIDAPTDPALKRLGIAIRHPQKRSPAKVTVNGANAVMTGEIVTVSAPAVRVRVVAEYD